MDDLIKIGEAEAHWNVSDTRILKYTVEMYHEGLKEHKLISAPELDILENKVTLQAQKWVEKWENLELKRKIAEEKEARTEEAKKKLEEISNLLHYTLSIDHTGYWELFKKTDTFPEKKPLKPKKKESYKEYPPRPNKSDEEFTPKFGFFEKLIKSKKIRKTQEYEERYSQAISKWEKEKIAIDEFNANIDKKYQQQIKQWEKEIIEWEKRKQKFYKEQEIFNDKIDKMKQSYFEGDVNSVAKYFEMVLDNSKYPGSFPKNFELEYNPKNRIIIVEYQLPSINAFPRAREVKYDSTRKKLKEVYISESQLRKMFDDAMYKITLRTIHEIFKADSANAIDAVSFNGWVKSINKATGKEQNNCILSIQVRKDEFLEIDLSKIDPKLCFKNLRGVASSKLSSLTPVQPILQLSKTDKRFVEGYNVVDGVDNSTNLAAMDWEDFENLIRELFEKEFMTNGGEVKVTQASRDGGVDAIAFDPDPIKGGKIVIQAKRYTNTVGVAAVRDLYGTVLNEGATKGILVTTADYGPDAYQFAKGKPITLLNGSNLLHLLQKHGYHAKIDLKEAKKILKEEESDK